MRTLAIGVEENVDHRAGGRFVDRADRENRFHGEFTQKRWCYVRTRGQRLEVPFFVGSVAPRSATPEHLPVIIPGAKLLLFPYELVANAQTAASRALNDGGSGVR